MTPIDYCREKAAASGSSFYYSFLFLPAERRNAITAFYAFCREVDDIVDETSDASIAAVKLAWWRTELDRLYAGQPTHPISKAMLAHVLPRGVRLAQLLEVIAGMEMDLHQQRYVDMASLLVYCHRAAGVVGEISAQLFGSEDTATALYANKLGLALQLTNILRDVGEDARRGRVYLPDDALAAAGLNREAVLRLQDSPALRGVLHDLAAQARVLYREAMALLPAAEVAKQRAGLIMARIYAALLTEIIAADCQVVDQRIGLPALRKLGLAWISWLAPKRAIGRIGQP